MTRKARPTKQATLALPLFLVLFLLTSSLVSSASSGLRKASAINCQSGIDDVFEIEGNIVDESAPPLDWNTLNTIPISNNVAPLIAHTGLIRDPAPSSIFSTANSRDNNDISEWRHSTGNVQDRGDISNAYGAAFRTLDNELIFVVGADRVDSGDGAFGFWFLQNRVVAAADGTFKTGPSPTDRPATHAIGDILILVDFSGGSSIIKIFEWVGSGGTEIGGTLKRVPTDPFSFVGGAVVNPVPIKAPWLYISKRGPAGIIPAGAFFEGAVNVSQLAPGAAFLCNPTFVVETRLSSSVGAPLQDFVLASFRPTVSATSVPPICQSTPTTLPLSLSDGTPPYTVSPTATPELDFVRGITIGATTPGGEPGNYVITTKATDVNGCIGSAVINLTIKACP
jgi:hypothetical protein